MLMAGSGKLPTATLVKALASPDPKIRALAARIAGVFDAKIVRPTLQVMVAAEADPHAGAEMIHALLLIGGPEQFASLEPHARRIGVEARLTMYAWLARTDTEKFAMLVPDIVADIGSGERLHGTVALASTLLNRPQLLDDYRGKLRSGGGQKLPLMLPPHLSVSARLLPLFQPDLLNAAAATAGCELGSSPRFGYAQVWFHADGRPQKLGVDASEISGECAEVLAGLARLTMADPDRPWPADGMQWLALPFSRAYAECGPVTAHGERTRPDSEIKAPKKVKDVRPEYPTDMQQKRVQGMVSIEATMSDTGCVSSARVVKSPALGLSLAALRAVSGWMFEPTTVDGKAVPVTMTVTVNFTLR